VKSIPGYFAPRAVGSDRLSPGSFFCGEFFARHNTAFASQLLTAARRFDADFAPRGWLQRGRAACGGFNGSRPAVDLDAELAAALLHRWFSIAERRNL